MYGLQNGGCNIYSRPKKTLSEFVEKECHTWQINKEDAMDHCKRIPPRNKGVNECVFFWYRLVPAVLNKQPLNGLFVFNLNETPCPWHWDPFALINLQVLALALKTQSFATALSLKTKSLLTTRHISYGPGHRECWSRGCHLPWSARPRSVHCSRCWPLTAVPGTWTCCDSATPKLTPTCLPVTVPTSPSQDVQLTTSCHLLKTYDRRTPCGRVVEGRAEQLQLQRVSVQADDSHLPEHINTYTHWSNGHFTGKHGQSFTWAHRHGHFTGKHGLAGGTA